MPIFSCLYALLNSFSASLLSKVNLIVFAFVSSVVNYYFTFFVLLNSVLFTSSFNNFTHSSEPKFPPPPPRKPPTAAELPEPTGLYPPAIPPPTYNFLGVGVGVGVGLNVAVGVGLGVGFANIPGVIGCGIPSALFTNCPAPLYSGMYSP
jgi:hypothetical protein